MNKRSKELHNMAEVAGLTVVSHGLGAKGRPTIRCRAPDGEEAQFSIAHSQGDYHGDKNELGRMKRWAREHEATAAPAPAPVAVVKQPPPRFAPSATFIPAKAVAEAPAARVSAPAPAPAPTPAPAPIAAPATAATAASRLSLVQQPPLTTTMTKAANAPKIEKRAAHKRVVLTQAQVIAMHEWIKKADLAGMDKLQDVADAAAKELGFTVTEANARAAAELAGITKFRPKPTPPKPVDAAADALELSRATAEAFVNLCESLAHALPISYAQLLNEKHGFSLPVETRKAA